MSTGVELENADKVREQVREYYGETLATSADLKTSACTTACAPPPAIREALKLVPREVTDKYYGCGSPFPNGIREGMRLLDLGCGSGRDCYVLAKLVGATGKVTGVDMTEAQLEVARAHVETYGKALGFAPPLHFVHGVIEDLAGSGIADNSIDVAVSNCVVNLSADKRAVLRGVFQALCNGGEFYQSDIYCDRRLPSSVRQDPVLLGECLGGAMYETDFLRLCREVGFADPREMSRSPLTVEGRLAETLGNAKFFSVTHRLFKLDGLEPSCEEYGQVASYKGTLAGAPHAFTLDAAHVFETGRWVSVCANTALILASSWLRPHFTVMGDTSVHYGRYAQGCVPLSSATQKGDSADCCS